MGLVPGRVFPLYALGFEQTVLSRFKRALYSQRPQRSDIPRQRDSDAMREGEHDERDAGLD